MHSILPRLLPQLGRKCLGEITSREREFNVEDLHSVRLGETAAVWTKFARKALSYHIILPRFLWRFFYELHLVDICRPTGEEDRGASDSHTQIGNATTGTSSGYPKPRFFARQRTGTLRFQRYSSPCLDVKQLD
jgi:hypothetical protein